MIILHGDNSISSRNALHQKIDQQKNSGLEVIRLDGKSVKPETIKQALETGNLFGSDATIIIENFLTRPKSKDKEAIEQYLAAQKPASLIIWEPKKLTVSQLSKLKSAQITEFKNNPIIFSFLENLGQNRLKSLRQLEELLRSESAGSIFFMLAKHIRSLMQLSDPAVKLAPWQKSKLQNQARLFSDQKLINLHTSLLAIDEGQKTGKSAFDLASELELFIIQLYDG